MARTLDEHVSQYCQVVLETCAYAGTGDVLKVQEMLAAAGEHITVEDNTAWKVRMLRIKIMIDRTRICAGVLRMNCPLCWNMHIMGICRQLAGPICMLCCATKREPAVLGMIMISIGKDLDTMSLV